MVCSVGVKLAGAYLTVEPVVVNIPPDVIVKGVPSPVIVRVSSVIFKVSSAPIVRFVTFMSVAVATVVVVEGPIVTVPKSWLEEVLSVMV